MTFLSVVLIGVLLYMDGTPTDIPQKTSIWEQQEITDGEIMEFFAMDDIAVTPQKKWVMALVPDMVHCAIIPTEYEGGMRGFIVEIVKLGDDPKYPIARQVISGNITNWETHTMAYDARMESWKRQCLPFVGELPDPDIKHRVLTYFNNLEKRTEK